MKNGNDVISFYNSLIDLKNQKISQKTLHQKITQFCFIFLLTLPLLSCVEFIDSTFDNAFKRLMLLFMVPNSSITIDSPTSTIEVGDEVMVYAGNEDGGDMFNYDFEWDFGDSISPPAKGISASHIYMQPGTYTITLRTNNAPTTRTITVTGNPTKLPPLPSASPVLELKFENNLNDTSPADRTITIEGGTAQYTRGVEGRAIDLTNGTRLVVGGLLGVSSGITVSFWAKKAVASSDSAETYMFKTASSGTGRGLHLRSNIGTSVGQLYDAWLKTASVATAVENDGWQGIASLINTQWHHYVMVYDGTQIKLFVDGSEYFKGDPPSPVLLSGTVDDSTNSLYIGSMADGSEHFNGYLDEIKIYNGAIDPRDIFTGFELWHADYHGHLAQYIYAQIPQSVYANAANRLRVTISGDTGYSAELVNKTGLASEERFFLNNSSLPAGNYRLTAELRDSGNNLIDSLSERFSKPYNGQPAVGIDENNAIRVNGELIFPITPFGLNAIDFPAWANYINALFNQGFWPADYTIAGWTNYLNAAIDQNWRAVGPSLWDGMGTNGRGRNSNIQKMFNYIDATKDSDGLFMWNWKDEPDLGDYEHDIPPTVQRTWAAACHKRDSQHLVLSNWTGTRWCNRTLWGFMDRQRYSIMGYEQDGLGTGHDLFNYYGNSRHFGKKILLFDVYGFDYYPIDFAPRMATTFTQLCAGWDNIRNETHNLVPIETYVETCDIHEDEQTPWAPTPEQLRMNIWLAVVHGVKHIGWFHYFDPTPAANFAVMAEFQSRMNNTNLMRAILGPDTTITVNVSPSEGRVDTMVKEYGGQVYLIAVRLSELISGSGNSVPVTDQNVSITFNSVVTNATATVLDEGRTVTITGGTFNDNFSESAVHIYIITP